MTYSIQQLAELAGVSVRTLHHYDEIGLLSPSRAAKNNYREYTESDLVTLQHILFYRELDFSLEDITHILKNPRFDRATALRDQRHLLDLKRKRLSQLIRTIDETLTTLISHQPMNTSTLYNGLSDEELASYAKEAKERWGHTDAYKQSQERYARMSKEDLARIQREGHELLLAIVAAMPKGPASPEVQALIAKHYADLRVWYEPNLEMYHGLATMYVDDPRFAKFFDKYAPGFATFMRDAMLAFRGE